MSCETRQPAGDTMHFWEPVTITSLSRS